MAEFEETRTMGEGNPGEAMTHSGPVGDSPATGGTSAKKLCSKTQENADGEINPSAPGQTGTTPHSDRGGVSLRLRATSVAAERWSSSHSSYRRQSSLWRGLHRELCRAGPWRTGGRR